MSYPRGHEWFRRLALGLAFASVIFAGRVSAAPHADRQFFDVAGLEATNDPYLSDVFVWPGESLGGPDGGPVFARGAPAPQVERTEAGTQMDDEQIRIEHALEAQAQGGLSGYVIEVVNTLVPATESLTAGDRRSTDTGVRPDGDQLAIEHELEALAQGGMAGYLNPEQLTTGTDRE